MAAKKTAKKSPKKTSARATKKASPAKKAPKKAAKRAAAKPAKRTAKKAGPRVHAVVHWEIQSRDPARLHGFYADALGWHIDANNPMNYGLVASKGKDGINGGIGGAQDGASRVTVYAAVPDVTVVLDRIASLGGQILMPRTDVGPVIMGLYTDPEGNVMGLIEG
jgi:predicted enzyme related to lactoylglutathione lyase